MGTLSLIWGILFIVLGLGTIPFGLFYFPLFITIIPAIIFISIGGTLIRKYEKDKEKSVNS